MRTMLLSIPSVFPIVGAEMKKYVPIIYVFLLVVTLLSLVVYSEASFILGVISLLFSLALSTYTIFQTYKGIENARLKVIKEVGMLILTLIVVLFFGGVAAMLANYEAGMRWGEIAGVLSAIGASFVVGYMVRRGMMRFNK